MHPREIKNSLRLALDAHPRVCLFTYKYLLGYRWRSTWTRFVDASTDLVIEGFQRSANSYAVRAFEAAQPEPLRLAHHAHLSSQIVCAVRWQKPVLLLIREPVDTIASYVAVWPRTPVATALEAYLAFYQRILPLLPHCLVADFDTVTGNFGAVIARLNARYGTKFTSPEAKDRSGVYQNLTVGQGSFRHSTNPAQARQTRAAEITGPPHQEPLSRARALYETCRAAAMEI